LATPEEAAGYHRLLGDVDVVELKVHLVKSATCCREKANVERDKQNEEALRQTLRTKRVQK
jgi:uncharacterized membrane-anchored protein